MAWRMLQDDLTGGQAAGERGTMRLRRIGASVLAAVALGLVAGAATASAEYPVTGVPEIGRCLSKPGSGGFRGVRARCIVHSATHTGNFEWYPGPGANNSVK